MSVNVTESQFYMWRAIFALAHADDIVTPEELRFMSEALEDIPFSEEQKSILQRDATQPQSVEGMFKKISDAKDQAEFFKFASKLAHIDGDFGEEEQEVMLRVKRLHLANFEIDDLIGNVNLTLDEDNWEQDNSNSETDTDVSYRTKFINKLLGRRHKRRA